MAILRPPDRGAALGELIGITEDLKAGIDAATLSDSVPHTSADGQELSLDFLKAQVNSIASSSTIEWVRGCGSLWIMHHPDKREKLSSILSKLLDAARSPVPAKLLSVEYQNEILVFKVQLYENRFIPSGSIAVWLDNPSNPVAVRPRRRGHDDGLTLSGAYTSKETMENFAIDALCRDLLSNTDNMSSKDLDYDPKPLGDVFPDFELTVREQRWAVEVTRIESEMVCYIETEKQVTAQTIQKFFDNRVTEQRIVGAVNKALIDKTRRRQGCPEYSLCCLLLVDVVDALDQADLSFWNGHDLSHFDAVVLVKMDGGVTYIKGAVAS